MKIHDFDGLKKNKNGVYDLTNLSFAYRSDISLSSYQVQSGEEMRIDLVSESIYGTNEYIDILLHLNNIDNPLNIKEGTVIKYPSTEDINLFRISEESKTSIQETLSIKDKKTKKDNNRNSYIEQGYNLPPVYLDAPSDPVKIKGDSIIIGGRN
jgi:hypothetical protein